eukprot:23410_1
MAAVEEAQAPSAAPKEEPEAEEPHKQKEEQDAPKAQEQPEQEQKEDAKPQARSAVTKEELEAEKQKEEQDAPKAQEHEKKEDPQKQKESPRYVINCKASRHNRVRPFEALSKVKMLRGIAKSTIYGHGIDIDYTNTGFTPVDYSLRGIKNHFVSALHAAFMEHLPFQIRPDDIWIILAQGIAAHITKNAEKLREKFVDFDDKVEIVVRDDSLSIGKEDNDWSNVLNQFEAGCRKLSNDNVVDLITSKFSTTTPVSKAASQLVLFKALSEYISFRTMTRSGIPQVELIGTVEDWKAVQAKCVELQELKIDLDFWLEHVMPIVNNIVETVVFLSENEGKPLKDELTTFWNSIYSFHSSSGSETCSGWAKTLFPYLAEGEKNEELDWQKGGWSRVSPGDFPATYSMCPMKWDYCGDVIETGMYGGIIGMAQQKGTGCMAP